MALEVTIIDNRKCYSFETGNRFFTVAGVEYEIVSSDSIPGDDTWAGVSHTFRKRFPGPDDEPWQRWECPMAILVQKILEDQGVDPLSGTASSKHSFPPVPSRQPNSPQVYSVQDLKLDLLF